MKKEKHYCFYFLLFLFLNNNLSSQIIITEIADPKNNLNARYIELYNISNSDIDLNIENYTLRKWTNDNTKPNKDIKLKGIIAANNFFIIAAKEISFNETYFISPNQTNSLVNTNGDDNIALVKNGTIVDIFGTPGEDGTNTCHEYKDGRAERKPAIRMGNSSWRESEWNIWADNEVFGCTSHNNSIVNTEGFDPGKWIGAIKPGISLNIETKNTSENSDTTYFDVVLDAQPLTNVTINIISDNTNEVIPNFNSLTFSSSNWNIPQRITLSGVDDNITDGDVKVSITVSVDNNISDKSFNNISSFFTLFNIDNENRPIIINEIHADPDSINGDANGDGKVHRSEDEFIEFYNTTSIDLDISGWILNDKTAKRHTFPENTIIPPKETLVLFGGGTPTNIPGLVQTADSNSLSLNNTGDTIFLLTETENIMINEIYKNNASKNQSIARNEDLTGTFVLHTNISTNSVLFSPGKYNTSNLPFSSTIKWTGTINNDWTNPKNWLNNEFPSSTSTIIIPKGLTNYPTVTKSISVNRITLESETSFISNSSVNGNITYNRELSNEWHLISSPIKNENTQNLINNNNFTTGSGNNIGLGFYNNNTSLWEYKNNTSTGNILNGTGMAVKTNNSYITFKGKAYTETNFTTVKTGRQNSFNLIGNPYTAYINSNHFLNNSKNTITLKEQTIWLWDGKEYITKNLAENIQIAPTQGFFVKAKNDDTIIINHDMLSHQMNDTFLKKNPKTTFELFIKSDNLIKSTKVFYIENKTTGFDNGYDSSLFEVNNNDFSIYTKLVNKEDDKRLSIQSLPNINFQKMIIPIGITSKNNKSVEFSVKPQNLPSGLDIYLEDKVENTFNNLSEKDYLINLIDENSKSDRFYIHLSAKKLSSHTIKEKTHFINIYKSNNKNIIIKGLSQKATLKIYTLLGEEIMSIPDVTKSNNKIDLSQLNGIYIFKLQFESSTFVKKIIL